MVPNTSSTATDTTVMMAEFARYWMKLVSSHTRLIFLRSKCSGNAKGLSKISAFDLNEDSTMMKSG